MNSQLINKLPFAVRKWLKGKPVLGLDTGSWSSKLVRAVPDPKGLAFDPCLLAPAEVAQRGLSKILAENKLEGSRSALSIADEKVERHEFHLPVVEQAELATAVDFEIKKTASSDYVFHDVLYYGGAQGFDIQCVMAAKEVVRGRFDEAVASGLRPEFLETESSALLATLHWIYPEKPLHKHAIIDLGHSSFRVIFIHQDRISFTRSLYFGLATICAQAGASLGISESELYPVLSQLGKGGTLAGTASSAGLERYLQECLYTLCEEFRRTEFYARDQKGVEDVEQIHLCGGGACVPAVAEYLRKQMPEKEIATMDPFQKLTPPLGVPENTGPIWACAVGLSLRACE